MAPKKVQNSKAKIEIKNKKSSRVWGIMGLVMLFLCGIALGVSVNHNRHYSHRGPMDAAECAALEKKIFFMKDSHEQRKLSAFYNRNCWKKKSDRPVDTTAAVVQRVQKDKVSAPRLADNKDIEKHCGAVESALGKRLADYNCEEFNNDVCYITRAEIYANLANRGCLANRENYKQMALRDITVARALNDDNFSNEYEARIVIDTYRKLEMKQEAQKVFDTVKKMADPAIDFILQVEQIIKEDFGK